MGRSKKILTTCFILVVSLFLAHCRSMPVTKAAAVASNIPKFVQEIRNEQQFLAMVGAQRGGEPTVKLTYEKVTSEIYFQNTNEFPFHLDFLKANFPQYATLDMPGFENLIFSDPPTLLAGGVYWLTKLTPSSMPTPGVLGFNIYFKSTSGTPDPNLDYIEAVYKKLLASVTFDQDPNENAKRIGYIFESSQLFFKFRNKLLARGINSYPVSAIIGSSDTSLVYSAATSYGFLRRITPKELSEGDYSAKDILILDGFEALPIDIGPVSGIITRIPQVPHSHVIFRSMNMKVPDVFIPNSENTPELSKYLGQLVEFEALEGSGPTSWKIRGINEIPDIATKAERYFQSRVPRVAAPKADLTVDTLFKQGSTLTSKLVEQYGAKGVNILFLDGELRAKGIDRSFNNGTFLIPFSYCARHMTQPVTTKACAKGFESCKKKFPEEKCRDADALCASGVSTNESLEKFAEKLASEPMNGKMLSDGLLRKASLTYFRKVIQKTRMEAGDLRAVHDTIAKTWPPNLRVRLRSSSNGEDLAGLTGAGLYDSHSACLADDNNSDDTKPSNCATPLELRRIADRIAKLKSMGDPALNELIEDLADKLTDKDNLEDAIRAVYSSLWNERAFLSRDFFRIPHNLVYMGIAAHPSYSDETANGVVIVEEAQNGVRADIVSQIGDISVTNPEIPNAVPEEVIAVYDRGTNLTAVTTPYVSRSNQVAAGDVVLTKENIDDLLRQLDIVFTAFKARDGAAFNRLDIEIKRGPDGKMLIKQARPI